MQSPEGQRISNIGCYLEIDPQKKLIWTNAFSPGFRPKSQINKTIQSGPNFEFTAIIELTDSGNQTRYTATVMHSDHESCQIHANMGFEQGWDKALNQMVEMIQNEMLN
jgi:uncharacterized protein YndB with AHSA1/START domain